METVNLNLNRSEVGYDTINEGFEERGNNSSENSGDSLPSTTVSVSSPKRSSRRAIQKRVVKVPIKDIEAAGGRFSKGDCTTPPSDSWAWRKYGQKPIKGSPYPRGYYRCSSSKGCPARKQVERNRLDPSMLLITYSYDHNHSFPISTRNHHHTTTTPPPKFTPILIHDKIKPTTTTTTNIITHEPNPNNFINHETTTTTISPTADVEFTWAALSSSSSTTTTSMYLTSTMNSDIYNYPMMGEEEESDLFADLGELPECSIVFGRKDAGYEEDDEIRRRRQCSSFSTTPWCGGTTSSTG